MTDLANDPLARFSQELDDLLAVRLAFDRQLLCSFGADAGELQSFLEAQRAKYAAVKQEAMETARFAMENPSTGPLQ